MGALFLVALLQTRHVVRDPFSVWRNNLGIEPVGHFVVRMGPQFLLRM